MPTGIGSAIGGSSMTGAADGTTGAAGSAAFRRGFLAPPARFAFGGRPLASSACRMSLEKSTIGAPRSYAASRSRSSTIAWATMFRSTVRFPSPPAMKRQASQIALIFLGAPPLA